VSPRRTSVNSPPGVRVLLVASAAPLPQPMLARSGPIPTRGKWSFAVKWDGFGVECESAATSAVIV
jgi:hypothetical protein